MILSRFARTPYRLKGGYAAINTKDQLFGSIGRIELSSVGYQPIALPLSYDTIIWSVPTVTLRVHPLPRPVCYYYNRDRLFGDAARSQTVASWVATSLVLRTPRQIWWRTWDSNPSGYLRAKQIRVPLPDPRCVVHPEGIEPPYSGLQPAANPSQLQMRNLAGPVGFEPTSSGSEPEILPIERQANNIFGTSDETRTR